MSDKELFLYMALGIIISVILPILSNAVKNAFSKDRDRGDFGQTILIIWQATWRQVRKYVIVAIFSMVTAVLLLAIYKYGLAKGNGGIIQDWWSALLYGYTYDSTVQKFVNR